MMIVHAIYTLDGKVRNCAFLTPVSLKAAEAEFKRLHPNASYWELGIPDEHVREALRDGL
jgi:hypothetical protein